MTDPKTQLTENMVIAATNLGIAVVREMAEQALCAQPNMTVKQFMSVLTKYETKVQATIVVK